MAAHQKTWVLSKEVLAGCLERAPGYDRDNKFFTEDFEELKRAGFLNMSAPKEFGGHDLSLYESCLELRRLAYHAGPTALATLMHLYWIGVAADLRRAGDHSMDWVLKESAAGEVFASGHAEGGNDQPFVLTTTKADRVDGGYRITGRKHFGCLTPVWTRLGLNAIDVNDPKGPTVIHAFLPRDSPGIRIEHAWDVLGMRATQSEDTVLEGAFVPDKYVAKHVPVAQAANNLLVMEIFAWTLMGFANIYFGMAQRALDLTIQSLKKNKMLSLSRPKSYHPEFQHGLAEMVIEVESIEPHIDKIAADWSDRKSYGAAWFGKLAAAKFRAVEGSWKVVDKAMELLGAFGIFNKAGFERLFRDARMGRLHPPNAMYTYEAVAKTALGIDLGELPRWG